MAEEVAKEFIKATRDTLAEGMRKIEHCVKQLSDEQVWWRPCEEMNSIANLMLHLCGNLRQWIVAGVGGAEDKRNRPREFGDRSNRPKGEVLAKLQDAVRDADAVLAKVTPAELLRRRRIQGFDQSGLEAIMHTVPHFRGHTQEIIHMTRQQLRGAYEFDFVPTGEEQVSAGGD
jgi:hypothetical protein